MGVDWNDIEESYVELQKARGQGQTSILMRLSDMQSCISEAIDAHVREVVVSDRWSWQRVADALGVTRQAASKRWTHKIFPSTEASVITAEDVQAAYPGQYTHDQAKLAVQTIKAVAARKADPSPASREQL